MIEEIKQEIRLKILDLTGKRLEACGNLDFELDAEYAGHINGLRMALEIIDTCLIKHGNLMSGELPKDLKVKGAGQIMEMVVEPEKMTV